MYLNSIYLSVTMKKTALIALLFFYLLSTAGVAVNIHYCGGKIADISVVFESKNKCKCGSKKMNRNCCKDQKHFFKVKDSHKYSSDLKLSFKNYSSQDLLLLPVFTQLYYTSSDLTTCSSTKEIPPDLFNRPVYIKNCSFLI